MHEWEWKKKKWEWMRMKIIRIEWMRLRKEESENEREWLSYNTQQNSLPISYWPDINKIEKRWWYFNHTT